MLVVGKNSKKRGQRHGRPFCRTRCPIFSSLLRFSWQWSSLHCRTDPSLCRPYASSFSGKYMLNVSHAQFTVNKGFTACPVHRYNCLQTNHLQAEAIMHTCALCRKKVDIDKFFTRKSVCPHCNADLHICLNCRFYSETSHNKCLEPKAEFQRSRDRANFCDYFIFRGGAGSCSATEKQDALKKLNDLFRK